MCQHERSKMTVPTSPLRGHTIPHITSLYKDNSQRGSGCQIHSCWDNGWVYSPGLDIEGARSYYAAILRKKTHYNIKCYLTRWLGHYVNIRDRTIYVYIE